MILLIILPIPFLSSLFIALIPAVVAVDALGSVGKRSINTATYNDLLFYFKYASSAYNHVCDKPNGNVLIKMLDSSDDTQGFIARDDQKKEIVVSLRGTESIQDLLTDLQINQAPFNVAGVLGPTGVMVHNGFQNAWRSVATQVISTVNTQLVENGGYSVVTTGHSLGGALSSLAAITLKEILPNTHIRMYTYGQPRTGNKAYANWVDQRFAFENLFRSVNMYDPAPHIFPHLILDYTHHGIEYWTFRGPPSAANTKKCARTGEDPNCSLSTELLGLPPLLIEDHLFYFAIFYQTSFCS
ncbi:alpha/beta-hydrolase [Collybia nuda]|uniref:Alpha/beta-hydrolase n=1 Tax=Collybia nuda TaxID=64659 RepID=A0A9P5XVI2_9AGAR|nr:alpha/beta-hydrolase [Collybia nuda]KAF9456491.1 alpha/beta-hydrolase [Collybia nuda]